MSCILALMFILYLLQMMMQLVKSSWILHLSCNKRRIAPIAALLSAILHPSIFPNLELHEANEKGPGPLKWVSSNIFSLYYSTVFNVKPFSCSLQVLAEKMPTCCCYLFVHALPILLK
jgi:hypothetical protein